MESNPVRVALATSSTFISILSCPSSAVARFGNRILSLTWLARLKPSRNSETFLMTSSHGPPSSNSARASNSNQYVCFARPESDFTCSDFLSGPSFPLIWYIKVSHVSQSAAGCLPRSKISKVVDPRAPHKCHLISSARQIQSIRPTCENNSSQ